MDTNCKNNMVSISICGLFVVSLFTITILSCDDMCSLTLSSRGTVPPVVLNNDEEFTYEMLDNVWTLYRCPGYMKTFPEIRVDNQNPIVADVWVDASSVLHVKARKSGRAEVILFAHASGSGSEVADAIHFTVIVK